jgi:diguanylate cyclase (GGDEF)-like protein
MLAITLGILFVAASLGLIPNNEQLALQTRSRMAENLAIQVAVLATQNELDALKDTFSAIVSGESEIRSVGLRKADGTIIAQSPNHEKEWTKADSGNNDGSHIVVPLMEDGVAEAKIEMLFDPLPALFSRFGISVGLLAFVGFMGGAGTLGYFFLLRRSLREMDPGSAFPDRVSSAFNSLAAGVLIIDENRTILLGNTAFETNLYGQKEPIAGRDVNELPWISADTRSGDMPWDIAMRTRRPVLGTFMSLRKGNGVSARLVVNATPIMNGDSIGGVMVTFDDVTMLHQKNEQLNSANAELRQIKDQVTAQNKKLMVLASTDALTGCLNRRTFLVEAAELVKRAQVTGQTIAALMLDIDHFKQINDQYGHPAGDAVLTAVGEILRSNFENFGIVGRYGGEEFGIVFVGLTSDQIREMADYVRVTISKINTWLPDKKRVTISMGYSMMTDTQGLISDVIKNADRALYKAKNDGRNRVLEDIEIVDVAAA